VTEGIIDINNI